MLGLKHWRPGVLKMNFMTTILWSKVTDMNVYDTWKTCRHIGKYKRLLKPSTLPYSSISHLKCLINWFVLCYPIFRIRTRVCVCLYWRISLTARPIWFSFTVNLLNWLLRFVTILGEGTSNPPGEIASGKNNPLNFVITFLLKLKWKRIDYFPPSLKWRKTPLVA